MDELSQTKIGIIGLGYVGLPLAVEFGKKYQVIGFDINQTRITELKRNFDRTLETSAEELGSAEMLQFTSLDSELSNCDVLIVTVPTPVDKYNRPDLTPLLRASETIGKNLKHGAIVVYESTVYPGCTEEDCVPVLEKFSGLKFNEGFYCGYSPERINPGDKEHRLPSIKKIVSGSTPDIANILYELYSSIITAGIHLAPSIKVAEAAKVIENAQRDINIAFVNELSKIFSTMGIDTKSVLEAAGTKWNFLRFSPGLVGGHCIGVDPYYLTHKAASLGIHPEIILAGRRLNDSMGQHVASRLIKLMIHKGISIAGAKVLVLGITFKENCPDIRNSKVIDIITELKSFGADVAVYDPWASNEEVKYEYGISMLESSPELQQYSGVILAVAHEAFKEFDLTQINRELIAIFDVKGFYEQTLIDERL